MPRRPGLICTFQPTASRGTMRAQNNKRRLSGQAIDDKLLRAQIDALAAAGLLREEVSGREHRVAVCEFVHHQFDLALGSATRRTGIPKVQERRTRLLADIKELSDVLDRFSCRWARADEQLPSPFQSRGPQ